MPRRIELFRNLYTAVGAFINAQQTPFASIGINYDFSAEIMEAQLVEANGDFFSVFVEDQQLHYSYPLKTILTVIEGQNGVHTGDSEQQDKFNAVIKVYPPGSHLMSA